MGTTEMAQKVDLTPPLPDGTSPRSVVGIETAAPVKGPRQWMSLGRLCNWLGGRGGTLVAPHNPRDTITQATSKTYNYRVWQSEQTSRRIWILQFTWDTTAPAFIDVSAGVGVSINGAAAEDVRFDWGAASTGLPPGFRPHVLVENLSGATGGEQDLTIEITHNSEAADAADLIVKRVACYEMPRPQLDADTAEAGVDYTTLAHLQPIYDGSDTGQSVDAVRTFIDNRFDEAARRNALFHWAVDEADAFDTQSKMFDNTDEQPLLGRKRRPGDETSVLKASVYARTNDGSTDGRVVLTMTNGDAVTFNVSTADTAFGWFTSQTIDVDAEDLGAEFGRLGDRFDQLDVEIIRDNGAGLIELAGISIGEHEQ